MLKTAIACIFAGLGSSTKFYYFWGNIHFIIFMAKLIGSFLSLSMATWLAAKYRIFQNNLEIHSHNLIAIMKLFYGICRK